MRSLANEFYEGKLFIADFTPEELEQKFEEWSIPRFRARQLVQEYFVLGHDSLDSMKTLPRDVRTKLSEQLLSTSVQLHSKQESADGTIKFLFRLRDGATIESVLIPSEMVVEDGAPKRRTLCISTQAGCPLGCAFCATATLGLIRNLLTAEIIDQVLEVRRLTGIEITNIVFMGMGEPMLNYDAVMKSVDILTHERINIVRPKRITLSTAGVVAGILQMADEKRQIKLALSLHATTNGTRSKLMPIARKHSLEELGNALEIYYRSTGIPVTFEYIIFEGLNDSDQDIKRLAKLTRRVPSKVNVIPFHSIEFAHPSGLGQTLKPASKKRFHEFIKALQDEHVRVMIRSSSGVDIDAACGQLALSSLQTEEAAKQSGTHEAEESHS